MSTFQVEMFWNTRTGELKFEKTDTTDWTFEIILDRATHPDDWEKLHTATSDVSMDDAFKKCMDQFKSCLKF